jgi:hypothetical protein
MNLEKPVDFGHATRVLLVAKLLGQHVVMPLVGGQNDPLVQRPIAITRLAKRLFEIGNGIPRAALH